MFLVVTGSAMLTLILLEAALYPFLLKRKYPWREGLSAMAVTAGNQMSQIIYSLIPLYIFSYVYQFRIFDYKIDTSIRYAMLFLLVDFAYYWGHRLSHHVRWLWASHSVHHSPNKLTLATAYQLAWTAWLSGEWLLWIPFLLLGIDPKIGIEVMTISLIYQFWLHTELVPKLRFFDLIFNSPSAHRIHHASNPEYLNKNFGGVLIVFDRIFGTYQAERAEIEIVYGLTTPVESLNPVTVAFFEWKILFRDIRLEKGLVNKLRVALRDPKTSVQAEEAVILPVGSRALAG